jgi:hypothetical protein
MYYKEDKAGQILQEGINEAGGMSSWIAAATSYSTSNRIMVPFYVYYSMFGFQRIGDLAWAAGDMQARGFLLGGTSGRTTLNGEGLQHEDGHSHILAGTIPNCISYDPTFAHEVGVILHHGLKRMVEKQDNVFYYLTLLNENYAMPGLTPGTEEQIIKGMYLCKPGAKATPRVQLLGRAPSCAKALPRRSCWRRTGACHRRRLELPKLQRAGPRRPGRERFNLLHPPTTRVCPSWPAAGGHRPGGGLHRLHEGLRRADPPVHPQGPHLQGAGHRRLWPQRLPQQAARALRGQPPLHRGGRAQGAERGRHGARSQGGRGHRQVRHQGRQGQPAVRLTFRRQQHGIDRSEGPDIGDFDEVAVIELLVKPGDTVKAEQSLITVESDKASMEIPSSRRRGQGAEGALGDKVKQGSVVLVLEPVSRCSAPCPGLQPKQAAAPAAPAPAATLRRLPAAAQRRGRPGP